MRRWLIIRAAYGICSVLLAVLTLTGAAASVDAARVPNYLPTDFVQTQVGGDLLNTTALAFAPDGRIFVAQATGKVLLVKNNQILATPVVRVAVESSGERGLIGIQVDPNFTTNHFLYLYYTADSDPPHNRVSRFTLNGDVVVPGSETSLLELESLTKASNHNGGAMHFGVDGKLYIAVGENTISEYAQSKANLFGKMLRLNPDGTIPADNPFSNDPSVTGKNKAIWAYGLRNPFTFSIQPDTGRMFINDVGEVTWEEINDGKAGANYGWPLTEGPTSDPRFAAPFYTYKHGFGARSGCAITGGTFYNPTTPAFPASYVGKYFFADFCSNWINIIDPANPDVVTAFATGLSPSAVGLQTGPDGNLYYLERNGEHPGLYKIGYVPSQAPQIVTSPDPQTVGVGQPVTFRVGANGTPPLFYQWQRNGKDIPHATGQSYTIRNTTLADNGATFQCVIRNRLGTATSDAATLTILNSKPPTATITSPAANLLWANEDAITYSAAATDAEDGALPDSAYHWVVTLQHADHQHPYLTIDGKKSGTLVLQTAGHAEPNIWYRFTLTVTDSDGLTYTTVRDIQPRKITLSFATIPSGLGFTLDGQPKQTPLREVGVVGIPRKAGVTPQTWRGKPYEFFGWSDGGAAGHSIITPAKNTTFTAIYKPSQYIGLQLRTPNDVHIGLGDHPTFDATLTVANHTGATLAQGTPVTFSFGGLRFDPKATLVAPVSIVGATWQSLTTGNGVALLAAALPDGQEATISLHISLTNPTTDVGKTAHAGSRFRAGQTYTANTLSTTFGQTSDGSGSDGALRTLRLRTTGKGTARTLIATANFFAPREPILGMLTSADHTQPIYTFADPRGGLYAVLRGLPAGTYTLDFTGQWSGLHGQATVEWP